MPAVNGRDYSLPGAPVVGICVDGCDPAYLEAAAGSMPNLQGIVASGCSGLAQAVVPSYTNPNNVAILTGTTPDVNGICGNYYYDETTGREVMMDDPRHLRAATVPAAFSAAGARVAAVTTKEKLRRFLGHGLRGISFSVERAEAATEAGNGIRDVLGLVGRENPGIYDPEASVFCLEAGARLLQREKIDLMYLSTTDFVQHKFAPGAPEAADFYRRLDLFLGELHDIGAVVGLTADHGMNDKTKADGTPNVQYLGSILEAAGIEARVILPVTDPYVVHHGALGSYATVYLGAAGPFPGARPAGAGSRSGAGPGETGGRPGIRAAPRPHRRPRAAGGPRHRARQDPGVARSVQRRERAPVARRAARSDGPLHRQPPVEEPLPRAPRRKPDAQLRPFRRPL